MTVLSEREQYAIQCVETSNTREDAAIKFGITYRAFRKVLKKIRDKGHDVPDSMIKSVVKSMIPGQREGFSVKAASTLVKHTDGDGKVVLEWLKQYKHEEYGAWEKAVGDICSKLPVAKIIPSPKIKLSDLLTLYTITDFHMGMLAYAPETGDDWDTDIATKVLTNAIAEMIARSPDSETGVFLQLGDFLHFDSLDSVTPSSKHILVNGLIRAKPNSLAIFIDKPALMALPV